LLELDHLASAVVDRQPYRLGPLREFGDREGWTVTTTAETCTLQQDEGGSAVDVAPADVLLALELLLRATLELWEDEPEPDCPAWVLRSREAHPRVVAALDGVERFEPAPGGES
jgi:hypothetical protein